jgi:hypothetical protein
MHVPDIDKLRRFSLVVALIILTYSIAGISLIPDRDLFIMGFPFKILRPDLLPIGLIMASIYTMIRFYFYGFMLRKSPYCVRRDVIDNLHCYKLPYIGRGKKKIPTYFGPTEFTASFYDSSREKAEEYIENFPEVFPKFARARSSMKIKPTEVGNEDGDVVGTAYDVQVVIPIRCRLAAIFQDIDYSSPIWLNLISLTTFFFSIEPKGTWT